MANKKTKKVAKKATKKKVAKKRFKNKLAGDIISAWLNIEKETFKDWGKASFWQLESKFLYRLCDKYGNDFIEHLTPFMEIESMIILEAPFFQTRLKQMSLAWYFKEKVKKQSPPKLFKKRVSATIKPKNTNIKHFLNNGKNN